VAKKSVLLPDEREPLPMLLVCEGKLDERRKPAQQKYL
jgi:hypothetical protein